MRDIERPRRIFGGSLLLSLTACIPLPNDLGDNETPGTSAGAPEGSGTAATGDSIGGTGPETTRGTTMGSSPGMDESASGADDGEEPVLEDMGIPTPGGPPCDEVGPSTVVVTSSQTAAFGALPVAYAVYGWDNCCVRRPRMVLTVDPPPTSATPFPAEYFTATVAEGNYGVSTYEGSLDAYFQDPSVDGSFSGPVGTFELLEPIDSLEPEPPDPDLRIRAHLILSAPDWEIDVEVEAPYCSAYDLPECPCE